MSNVERNLKQAILNHSVELRPVYNLPVVIIGPQGCGKTTNSRLLSAFYRKPIVVDDADHDDIMYAEYDRLLLTSIPPHEICPGSTWTFVMFNDAMQAIESFLSDRLKIITNLIRCGCLDFDHLFTAERDDLCPNCLCKVEANKSVHDRRKHSDAWAIIDYECESCNQEHTVYNADNDKALTGYKCLTCDDTMWRNGAEAVYIPPNRVRLDDDDHVILNGEIVRATLDIRNLIANI